MIIRTDLYAVLAQGRKKPNKLLPVLAGTGALLLGLVGLDHVYLSKQTAHLRIQKSALESKLSQLETDLAQAREAAAQSELARLRRKTVLDFAFQRLTWAPLLQEIFAVIPETIQLQTVEGSTPWQTDCTLKLTGKCTSEQPRLEADKFRSLCIDSLAGSGIIAVASFGKLEDLENPGPLPESEFEITLRWTNAKTN